MKSGKCGCSGMVLCPISLGFAMAITYALTIFIVYAVVMTSGGLPEMEALRALHLTWMMVLGRALWGLLEGFIFGVVLALLYDLFSCCMRKCGKSTDGNCGCDCGSSDGTRGMKK